MRHMTISEIAYTIDADWSLNGKGVSPYARPYLDAMKQLVRISDDYGLDSADSIVRYFLSNASSYRGAVAREAKAELKKRLK